MFSGRVVIRDLDAMESIVSKNKYLKWDGWDILYISPRLSSFMDPKAQLHSNEWHRTYRYSPGRRGYVIPREFIT